MIRSTLAAIILCISCMGFANAQKITVRVVHTGDDSVGINLAYEIREAIRRSSAFEYSSEPGAGLTINLVTLPPEKDFRDTWSVGAVTYTMINLNDFQETVPNTWYPVFLGTKLVTVGRNKVSSTAQSIVAGLDRLVEQYREDSRPR